MKDPPQARKRLDLLRTLYYYSKDAKKHSRIIKVLFWALIVPLLQETKNNQTALFGLKSLNQLITNESSHEQIIGIGKAKLLQDKKNVTKMVDRALKPEGGAAAGHSVPASPGDGTSAINMKQMNTYIESRQNPVRILANIILRTEPSIIMIEATKAIRNLSKTEEVVDMLMEQQDLLRIYKDKIEWIDSHSQENIMMTISAACKKSDYRQKFVDDDDFINTLLAQIKSVSRNVTLQALRICRQLAKDEQNLQKLQGGNLRLSRELIYAFQWLDAFITKQENDQKQKQPLNQSSIQMIKTEQNQTSEYAAGQEGDSQDIKEAKQLAKEEGIKLNDAIYREISKAFEYILKYYDLHKRQIDELNVKNLPSNQDEEQSNIENQIIETIVQLGRSTRDLKTTLNAATSLAHITEVLDCNKQVATDDAIDFMIDMLKDTKNVKHHRQGCRYFANLSFYKNFRDQLIKKEIATFLLKAIEGHLEEDTIKHAAIALANLSSHKDFMRSFNQSSQANEATLSSKAEKWMIKPLIHLLDSAQDHKIDLIQSACITLCNMASKPSLHKNFVQEPEISTFKNCLANPIDKGHGNELSRFMIKLVCNLTKNPEVLPHLLKKGFLEILFELLNHEREKEIFGNVVTAIAYLSVHQEAQDEIKRQNIIPKILEPLTQIHEVDQKLIIIAITSMLFNGQELQKEFIKHNGLESEEILNKIIDQECLNTIIISCLRSKDIDLETLKEITKIFINLILWRKLKTEIIETTCCLCDIGLMIDDLDMNILAMFCLNSLSEDEENHEKIIQQGSTNHVIDKLQQAKDQGTMVKKQKDSSINAHAQQSIFPRIQFLLKHCRQDLQKIDGIETSKRELLITLITSFYLNLARNKNNRDFLLKLELFKSLSELMLHQSGQPNLQINQTALCYTNTIFSKLLKFQQSRVNCMNEEGYKLFISILKHEDNKHLFLESLDCIKLFLMTRKNLEKFKEIPECIQLDKDCPELNVSYLQVLAILSFEKKNHEDLKKTQFLTKLDDEGMFAAIFDHFDKIIKTEKSLNDAIQNNNSNFGNNKNIQIMQITENSEAASALSNSIMQSQFQQESTKRINKYDIIKNRQTELALAISIILSNLSNDEKYIKVLLGVKQWKERYNQQNRLDDSIIEGEGQFENKLATDTTNLSEEFILQQYEVERITGLFNLLSHPDPFISEQISILLANVSNSEHFRFQFISDRCMKSIIKILRFKSKTTIQTEVSLLAILITILNLSAVKDVVTGIENMNCLDSLESIVSNEAKPLEQRSIALMAISNFITQSKKQTINHETQEFAIYVLENQKEVYSKGADKQNKEVVKNTVYASLILFYNLFLQYFAKIENKTGSSGNLVKEHQNLMEKLITCLDKHVMDDFTDPTIVNVVLHLVTLFTKNTTTASLLFKNPRILAYIFNKLQKFQDSEAKSVLTTFQNKYGDLKANVKETIRLATLALSRLSSKFEEENENREHYKKQLKEFDNFECMLGYIKSRLKQAQNTIQQAEQKTEEKDSMVKNDVHRISDELEPIFKETLKYLLNILENITSVAELRDQIDCPKLFGEIKDLFTEFLDADNKKCLINIMFNLNFKLTEPRELSQDFLKLLLKTYNDENSSEQNQSVIQRKMISIVVVASALEANHEAIIKSNFYMQFKKNINEDYVALSQHNEEIELFGLVNIALNKRMMDRIYADLKKIHKIAIKNDKIDFKTKVDMFTEVSKYIAKLSRHQHQNQGDNQGKNSTALKEANNEKSENIRIQECLKALIYTIVRLTVQLDKKNFTMYKYFLLAILDCTHNLKHHLKYLIQIKKILEFLRQILKQNTNDFNFKEIKQFQDPQVLVFSLKMIVCEIFFNLKYEKEFFKLNDISEAIGLLIEFSQQVLQMSIEKKTSLVSNTLRLLSQMITTIHQIDDAGEIISRTKAIPFVKQSLQLSRDMQPCINIDALFCLSNMMNVPEIAEREELCNMETLFNAFAIYFAFNEKIALDECLITYLFSISKLPKYQVFLKDKSKVLFKLMERHNNADSKTQLPSCRQKLFSTFHNLTQTKEICEALDIKAFIQVTNTMLKQTCTKDDNIHGLAMKTLINLCRYSSEAMFEAKLEELLGHIAALYKDFSALAKQYALRLVTILTSEWKVNHMEGFLPAIVKILSEFICHCKESVEVKLVLINLEKLAQNKSLMQKLAKIDGELKRRGSSETPAANLIEKISEFLSQNINNSAFEECTDQLLRFCKKMSAQSSLQAALIESKIYQLALSYLHKRNQKLDSKTSESNDEQLKSHLQTIQNVMKMVKHLFEGAGDKETQKQIVDEVEKSKACIERVDDLLQNRKSNDDLSVMIVKIITCFNSISNNMDETKIRKWISDFSKAMQKLAIPDKSKGSQSSYMERYVFIIELLVTKNLEKIDLEMTKELLEIYKSDKTFFSKTIWYKMLKILGHLLHLQDIMARADYPAAQMIDAMFEFIIEAQEKTDEHLSFLYFMRVTMIVTKKRDNDVLFQSSKQFKLVLDKIFQNFEKHKLNDQDDLLKEIILYQIDYFRFLMGNKEQLKKYLNDRNVVQHFIVMLAKHTDPKIVKALSFALKEASNTTQFYPDLLNDNALNTILEKMLHHETQQDSLEPLFECLNSVLSKTKAPIKYLLSTSMLKLTEGEHFRTAKKEEANILFLLKVLQSNLKSLDQARDQNGADKQNQESDESACLEKFSGFQFKAHKYCLLAMSNILIKTGCDYIFTRKHKLIACDELTQNRRTSFEKDPQMNLRFLTLINVAFNKDQSQTQIEQWSNEEKKLKDLIDYILNNVYIFRNILDAPKSYFKNIPKRLMPQGFPIAVDPLHSVLDDGLSQSHMLSEDTRQGARPDIVLPKALDPNVSEFKEPAIVKGNSAQSPQNQYLKMRTQAHGGQEQLQSSQTPEKQNEQNLGDEDLNIQVPGKFTKSTQKIHSDIPNVTRKQLAQVREQSENDDESLQATFINEQQEPNESIGRSAKVSAMGGSQMTRAGPSQVDAFFFETNGEGAELMKSDAIRYSLCLSVRAMYKMTKHKKRYACNPIIENRLAPELFRFFRSYVNHGTTDTIPYVRKVIKIFQNCSEVNSLCKDLIDKEVVTELVQVANKVLDDRDLGHNTLEIRDSILEPILKTFESLNQSEFVWHLKKQNLNVALEKIKKTSKKPQIVDMAESLMESIAIGPEEHDDSQQLDFAKQIDEMFVREDQDQKQLEALHQIEDALKQRSVILDRIGNPELGKLIQILQQKLKIESPSHYQVTFMETILKILNCVYEHKYRQPSASLDNDMIKFMSQIDQVHNQSNVIDPINNADGNARITRAKNQESQKVHSVIELKETFETLLEIVKKEGQSEILIEQVIKLMCLYSESNYKLVSVSVDYVLPALEYITSPERRQQQTQSYELNRVRLNQVLDCILYFLQMRDDKTKLLHSYNISQLLLQLAMVESLQDDSEMLKKLQDIVKAVFYNQGALDSSGTGKRFVKYLLKHSSQEMNKLGVFSLYCIALSLQDQENAQNIHLFEDEEILDKLMLIVKEKHTLSAATAKSQTQKQMVQRSDQIVNEEGSQALQKIRMIALNILVLICEHQSADFVKFKQTDKPGTIGGDLTGRIFIKHRLLDYLISICLHNQSAEMTDDEVKFIARAFASMPPEVLIRENIKIFDKSSIEHHERELQRQADQDKKPLPMNRGQNFKNHVNETNLLSWLKALAHIASRDQRDAESSYFALYAAMSLVFQLNLLSPINQPTATNNLHQKSHIDISQLTLADLDYQMLTACLMQSNILDLSLLWPTYPEANDDIMRVCTKLVITLVFKASKKRTWIGKAKDSSKMTPQMQELYQRLNVDFRGDKPKLQELLNSFMIKVHAFEIQNIYKEGYVQFIHLVSQIVLQTTTPTDAPDDRSKILPTQNLLCKVIKSWSDSMDPEQIQEIIDSSSSQPTKAKKGKKGAKANDVQSPSNNDDAQKMLLYKFFFFNYVFQMTGSDIMGSLGNDPHENNLKAHGINLAPIEQLDQLSRNEASQHAEAQKAERIDAQKKANIKSLQDLVKSLMLVLETLQSRRSNSILDKAIKPLGHNPLHDEEESKRHVGKSVEELNKQIEEDDQKSTCLQIVKMTMFNLQTILNQVLDSDLSDHFEVHLTQSQVLALESILTDYEQNGDIVEPTYVVLDRLLHLSKYTDHPAVKLVEGSKVLMRLAIMHTSVYQCQESYTFLRKLISMSDRFANKPEMEQAIAKIAPPDMQNTDLEAQTNFHNASQMKQMTQGTSGRLNAPLASSSFTAGSRTITDNGGHHQDTSQPE